MPADSLARVAFVTPFCLLAVTTLTVVVRIWRKVLVTKTFEWEDGLICVSFCSVGLLNLGCSLLTFVGLGQEMGKVDQGHVSQFLKIAVGMSICYSMGLALAKIVLVDQLLRAMPPHRATRRTVLRRICAALFGLQWFEEVLVALLSCHPTQGHALLQFHGTCFQQRPMWLTGLVLNLAFALHLFVGPIASLWMWSEMGPAQKIWQLVDILVVGFVFATTTGRTIMVSRIGSDITYDYASAILWSSAEADAIVICACLPWIQQTWAARNDDEDKSKPTSRPESINTSSTSRRRYTMSRESGDSAEVQGEVHEGTSVIIPGPLSPTPREMIDWIEKVQAFPTEGRSHSRMASEEMGTTSSAEAQSALKQWMPEGTKGILVKTEVWRTTSQDPDFPFRGDCPHVAVDASASPGADRDWEDVPSLDELPLPAGSGILSS